MRVLSIDPSTVATGWAVMEDHRVLSYGEIKCSSSWTGPRKMANIWTNLNNIFAISNKGPNYIDRIVCEDQFSSKFPTAVMAVSRVRGIVELLSGMTLIPFIAIDPKTVKKTFSGTGNAGKELMVAKAKEIYGIEGITDNTADAIAIGYTFFKMEEADNGNIQGNSGS